MTQIQVKLNPDVQPSGSDLTSVNAARRSFNTRSDWDFKLSHWVDGPSHEELEFQGYVEYDESTSGTVFFKLKEKDKRLLEFLARGMTAADFKQFSTDMAEVGHEWCVGEVDRGYMEEFLKLLYQWRNTPTHDTPFNHCFISFEVQAPIFVARQLVKTEYTILSEFSRRYITDEVEFYEHEYREVAENKKQGSGGPHKDTEHWQKVARMKNLEALDHYDQMIKEGIAPEQARGCLPQDLMTAWTWSGTLGAFAKMCRERLHPDAQVETREVAQQVYNYLKEYYPVSAKCLVEGPDV